MYTPSSFREERPDVLREMIRRNSFGILVTHSRHNGAPEATHIPFMIETDRGEHGTLVTHMARANRHWRSLDTGTTALVIFRGPHSYISPSWYRNKVTVPTWNYAAVHAYGTPVCIHDTGRLRDIVTDLVHFHEATTAGSDWDLAMAEPVMETQLKAIVGIEIAVEKIEGKMKFNQNRSPEDRQGVVEHLAGSADSMQRQIAAIMRDNYCPYGENKGGNGDDKSS